MAADLSRGGLRGSTTVLSVIMLALTISAGSSQPQSSPQCREAISGDERSIVDRARMSLARLDELADVLQKQLDDVERRLSDPGSPASLPDMYRQLRLQLRQVEIERGEFTRLLTKWCRPS